mgnify:CR=1 FL=1
MDKREEKPEAETGGSGAEAPGDAFVTIFDDTYDLPDCRGWFRMMDALGYRHQHFAAQLFRHAQAELARLRGRAEPRVVDFACGYGIVAALMRFDVTLEEVLARYRDARFDDATPEQVIAWDRAWLGPRRRTDLAAHITGIDVAANAVAYAQATGILDAGFAEDLDSADPSPELAAALAGTDLIVEAGSVAHLMPRTLDRLLGAAGTRKPWVLTSPTRGNDRPAALDVFRAHGLTVASLPVPPFVHRRFESADEQARGIANARAAGHTDTDLFEATGHFHAQAILAHPSDETVPLDGWPLPH